MTQQEKFDKLFLQNPHPVPGFNRPHVSRRQFMNVAGAGVTASWLASPSWTLKLHSRTAPTTRLTLRPSLSKSPRAWPYKPLFPVSPGLGLAGRSRATGS